MKVFLLSFSLALSTLAHSSLVPSSRQGFLDSEALQLSRSDLIIGEHLTNMFKLIDKGYISSDVLSKLINEVSKSKNYQPFLPWLKSLKEIQGLSKSSDIIAVCRNFITRKEKLPLERKLERMAGNYCRERGLEAVGRDIEKTNTVSDEGVQFIQDHLRFFLTKKNKKNFAYFIQAHSDKPEILKRVSQEVTAYSVRHDIVPSQEVLKDMLINEQITKLIQAKGFNPLQHQNVFYAEFGKLIEQGYRTLDDKPNEPKAKEHLVFLKNYLELNQDHLPVGLCLSRLNDFAKAVFRAGFKDLSRDIFKYIVKKNNKEIHEDALFFYLWTYLASDDYKGALKLADSYKLLHKDATIQDARLRFWIALSQEIAGKKEDALLNYDMIVTQHPLSYYAIMANKKLQVLNPSARGASFYTSEALKNQSALSFSSKDLDPDYVASLVRLKAWAKIDTIKMMNLELRRLNNHSMPDFLVKHSSDKQLLVKSDLHLINAKIIQDAKNYLATFRYLYTVLDKREVVFNRDLLEILYPRPYFEDLVKALKKDSIDPIIVLSLIRQESVFNPLARSPVGARGLMQIMPNTAKRIKRSVKERHLADPKINIDLGTKYFKGLVKRYDGNLVYVLSAYNAGESRVERWKGLYFDTDGSILKNIEAIPFLETRNYVKLIFRNIFFYKLLIEGNKELANTGEHNKIFDVNLGFKR